MKKSKLIDLLKTFSKEELKSFKDFIASPYYNKKKELISFYDYIYKQSPDFTEKKLNRQKAFKTLYPNKPYDEKTLGYLMSYTSKLIEQFISIRKYEKDDVFPDYYLLSALSERKLDKYYKQEQKKINDKSVQTKNNKRYYYKQHLLSDTASQHFLSQSKRKQDDNLQKASDYLDLFYVTSKLIYSCALINRNIVLSTEYKPDLFFSLDTIKDNESMNQSPIIIIYQLIYKILNEESPDSNFKILRQHLKSYQDALSNEELLEVYQYAINICARMIRKGKVEYYEETFNLYYEGIEQEIFFDKGYLSPWAYTNTIRLGVVLKRYDWIKEFIYEKNEKLPESFRENALHYNLAELYYHMKDFDKAIHHLNYVKFSDLIIHLGSREILARVYYETGEEEALLSLIASFSIFLKRNKDMSNNIKMPYLNFCDLLNQLMRRNPKKLPAIREKIKTTNPVTGKSWLLKICDELHKELKVPLPENA